MVSADNISDSKMDMEDSGFVFDLSDREDGKFCMRFSLFYVTTYSVYNKNLMLTLAVVQASMFLQ